eukprot:scaffold80584_cov69-Phaeocystis_antarctica.AAC.4
MAAAPADRRTGCPRRAPPRHHEGRWVARPVRCRRRARRLEQCRRPGPGPRWGAPRPAPCGRPAPSGRCRGPGRARIPRSVPCRFCRRRHARRQPAAAAAAPAAAPAAPAAARLAPAAAAAAAAVAAAPASPVAVAYPAAAAPPVSAIARRAARSRQSAASAAAAAAAARHFAHAPPEDWGPPKRLEERLAWERPACDGAPRLEQPPMNSGSDVDASESEEGERCAGPGCESASGAFRFPAIISLASRLPAPIISPGSHREGVPPAVLCGIEKNPARFNFWFSSSKPMSAWVGLRVGVRVRVRVGVGGQTQNRGQGHTQGESWGQARWAGA